MCLIKTILFGQPLKVPAPVPMIKRRPRHSPRAPSPAVNPFAASNAAFFHSIMLRKRAIKASCSPVTPVTPAPVTVKSGFVRLLRRTSGPSGPSFPRGLCYLVGIAPCDRGAAMLSLGSYPLVQSLLNSWLFQPSGIHLVARSPGLYHAVSADVLDSVPFCLGLPGWKVGADDGFPPLPRNTNHPCLSDNHPPPRFSDNPPPRPPRYFEDGRLDPSNRSGRDHRLPSFGPARRGAGRGRAHGRAPSPAPFRQQFFDGDHRGGGRGVARRDVPHETWQDANQSPFDIAIANMKKSLEDLPRYIAVDAWNDFLSWLKDYLRASGVEKNATVPFIEAHFGRTLVAATRVADDRRQIEELSGDAHKLSLHLASKLKHLDELHFKRESALPGADIERIDAEIEVAKYNVRALEAIMEEKEKEAQTADSADEITDNADFVPLDDPVVSSNVRSWPEDNYEDFATKRAAVSDAMVPTSKLPSASLFAKQKTPAGSKTLMPRPLELFTAAEIDGITPKSIKSRWCNFYEDPVEPAKCWTQEEFQVLYEKPGFHFMVARVAQVGAQF